MFGIRWYAAVRAICSIFANSADFLLCVWFDSVDFNHLQCPNEKMYDVVFADRFRYELARFRIDVLVWLSRIVRSHVAYETDAVKTIAFCQISCCLHDLIRLNSIICHVQTTRCTMMWFSLIDSDINWQCLKYVYWPSYLDSWYTYCIWNKYINIATGNWHGEGNDLSCWTVVKRKFRPR